MSEQSPLSAVGRLNLDTWTRGEFVGAYANRTLRPVEVLLMVRLREHFCGRVLELGCGPGRITGYLVALAQEAWGLDPRRRCSRSAGGVTRKAATSVATPGI
jgi:hypothetical protein